MQGGFLPYKAANNTLDKTFQYEYNDNGIGNIDRIITNGVATQFTYGNATHPDRLTQVGYQSIIYDANGCTTRYGDKIFVWNKGKLVRIYDDVDPNSSDSSENVEFAYNGYGQRVSKTYEYDPGPDYTGDFLIGANVTYTYDNAGRLIREVREESYTESADVTYDIMYLYDESSIIGCTIKRGNLDYGTYYFQRNLLGDVVAIYDTAGTKVEGYAYDAFGNCTLLNNSLVGKLNPIRYRGYYFDTETGWYFLNARYYAPELRRFISPDDTAYLDPESVNGLNLYCYCNNDPINYCDPSGHKAEWWAWIISGLLVTAGIIMSATGFGGIAGGILIGAGAGSLINGYVNEANGGSFLAGWVGGAISGALCGIGAGLAGNFYITATTMSNLAALGWFGASIGTSFAGGFIGNIAGTFLTAFFDKQDVNIKDTVISSIAMGGLNMFAGVGSGLASIIAKTGRTVGIYSNSQLAHRLLAGIVAGGTEAFYDITSYLYGMWN